MSYFIYVIVRILLCDLFVGVFYEYIDFVVVLFIDIEDGLLSSNIDIAAVI